MADQGASQRRSTGTTNQTQINQAQTQDPLPGAGEYSRTSATLDSHDSPTSIRRKVRESPIADSPETPNAGTYSLLSATLDGHDVPSDPSRASQSTSERLVSSPETPDFGRYYRLTAPYTPIGGTAAALTTYYLLRAYDVTCPTPQSATWVGTAISYAGAPTPPCGGSYGPITVLVTWRA